MPPNFTPIPEDLMYVVFGEIFKKLTNGGSPEMLGPNNFIAWEPAATVIDPQAFDFAAKGFFGFTPKVEGMSDEQYSTLRSEKKYASYAYAHEFSRLVDQIPSLVPDVKGSSRPMTVFSPDSDQAVSQVYGDVLEYCVVKDSKIDPKVTKKLETLRKKIFTIKKLANPDFDESSVEHPEDNPKFIFQMFPSPAYVKYLEYEALYDQANERLTDLQKRVDAGESEAMTEMSINGSSYKRKRDEALKRWETIGYKGDIEKAMNYIDEIESSNFITIKKKYESEYNASKRTDLGGLNTYLFSAPLPATVLKNASEWLDFKFTKSNYESSSRSTSHSWAATASFFSIGVGGGGTHSTVTSDFNFNDFELSFKLSKCFIVRGWMGMNFLRSRYWKFAKDSPQIVNNQIVSDGNGKGLMPAVVTELYFIKDLKIGFRKGSDSYKKAEDHVRAGAAVSFGIFNFGGTYGYDDVRVNSSGERQQQSVASPGILLIGRKCNVLPQIPNPLPTIKDNEWVEVN